MERTGSATGHPSPANFDATTAEVLRSAIHDLKGPVSRLRTTSQLLARSAAGNEEDTKALLQHVTDSAQALDNVVEGLRYYSDLCTRAPEFEPLDLAVPLEDAITDLAGEISMAGAAISHDPLPVAPADRSQFTWLFQELLANALRFRGDAPPRVHISAEPQEDGEWSVTVADNGPGIEAEFAERVFRPFRKLSEKGGAGMGLTTCRRIVEMHGGRMWMEPRSNGAAFRFVIPGEPGANVRR